jgi:uncharacterized protein YifN (PemK superfamily)
MITPARCIVTYGEPDTVFERKYMVIYTPPADIHELIVPLPAKIYMNIDMVQPFENALIDICNKGFADQIKEWGGCFMIRNQRGTGVNGIPAVKSIHSWGIACDINESTNPMYSKGNMSPELVKCFTDNGFDWGGTFGARVDPMHYQLKEI